MQGSRPSVLVVVENLSVPFDRRVWQESLALERAGYDVTVVCPRGRVYDEEPFEVRNGIAIHRYPLRAAAGGPAGYVIEYGLALWHTHRLARRLARRRRFDVVHICNPPDVLFLAVRFLKRRGARCIFDHHDLVPELYRSRFGRGADLLHRVVLRLERLTFAWADVVIATNESYRAVALSRGGKQPDDVVVVRSGPDLTRFPQPRPVAERAEGPFRIAYLGVMGPQDGIDHALHALALLAEQRSDWHATFVGDGDVRGAMLELADELGLGGRVEFVGRLPDDEMLEVLGAADVCLAPDPLNPLNDVSTMNKIVEYMALGKPIVSYDLREARVSAAEAALYAAPNDPADFARCISELLDDPEARHAMGRYGRTRVEGELSWAQSERRLLAAYARACPDRAPVPAPDGAGAVVTVGQ